MQLLRNLLSSLSILIIFIILFGLIYPLGIMVITHPFFADQANGSLISKNKQIIGSHLIGQNFTQDYYFHPRPSAAGKGYDPMASSGSNLGPANKIRRALFAKRVANAAPNQAIPIDLITASGSGLDPDISPESAFYQAPRIAKARKLPLSKITTLIKQHIQKRTFFILGEPRVNVLELNLALDKMEKNSAKHRN